MILPLIVLTVNKVINKLKYKMDIISAQIHFYHKKIHKYSL